MYNAAATAIPDAETIRQAAQEVVQRPHYRLDETATDTLWLWELAFRVVRVVVRFFEWFFELTDGLPMPLRWIIVVGLTLILILLIAHITYTFGVALRGGRRAVRLPTAEDRRLTDPEQLEKQAHQAGASGDYLLAMRLLFRAALLRMERAEKRRFRPGLTNREHLLRYRDTPLFDPLHRIVVLLERKWYGDEPCGPEDYSQFESAHRQIRGMLEEKLGAHSA